MSLAGYAPGRYLRGASVAYFGHNKFHWFWEYLESEFVGVSQNRRWWAYNWGFSGARFSAQDLFDANYCVVESVSGFGVCFRFWLVFLHFFNMQSNYTSSPHGQQVSCQQHELETYLAFHPACNSR